MNAFFKAFLALLAGVVTFLAVLAAVTELLAQYVWPALLVSLPVALVAGGLGLGLAYLGLGYREERAATGSASTRTVALLGGLSAGAAAFTVTSAGVTAVLGVLGLPFFTATMLGGFPAGTLAGVVAGFLVARRLRRQRSGKADLRGRMVT